MDLCEERDSTGASVSKRFFGGGEQISGTNYFFTTDHLGSVREMMDGSGAIRARYEYDPYGGRTRLAGDLDFDFGFTGHYFHSISTMYLTLFRAFDSGLGRWISADPIEEEGGLNLHAYAAINPINNVDLLGLQWRLEGGHGGTHLQIGNQRWDAATLRPVEHMGETPPPLTAGQIEEIRKANLLDKVAEQFPRGTVATELERAGIAAGKMGRLSTTLAKKVCKRIAKAAPLIALGAFAYDAKSEGLAKAVDNQLWPVSELWQAPMPPLRVPTFTYKGPNGELYNGRNPPPGYQLLPP